MQLYTGESPPQTPAGTASRLWPGSPGAHAACPRPPPGRWRWPEGGRSILALTPVRG